MKEIHVSQQITKRLENVRKRMREMEIDTLMIMSDENRRYLSGFSGRDSQFDESSGALFISDDTLLFATDSRFTEQAAQEAPFFQIYCYTTGLSKEIFGILSRMKTRRLGYEAKRLSCHQQQEMQDTLSANGSNVILVAADASLETLRSIKDETEIAHIRNSLALAENAFLRVQKEIEIGMTEKELSWKLEQALRNDGADGLSFPSIVAIGQNSALPHAIPGETMLREGTQLLFDWGALLNGYCSDITRTLFIGESDERFEKIFQTVLEANQKATLKIRAGVSGKEIDRIARSHIEAMGYKEYFSHGLGHGVGLAVHEPPRLSPLKEDILQSGMVVTVEPGVYIPGWGGVRLENLVVVREDCAETLNTIPCIPYGWKR